MFVLSNWSKFFLIWVFFHKHSQIILYFRGTGGYFFNSSLPFPHALQALRHAAHALQALPADHYMFKVNNRSTQGVKYVQSYGLRHESCDICLVVGLESATFDFQGQVIKFSRSEYTFSFII